MKVKRNPIADIESADAKVRKIFARIAGSRIKNLDGARFPLTTAKIIDRALRLDIRKKQARRAFAFHMVDWNEDAARIVALHLYPERFTNEEVWAIVFNIVIHAPNHLAAAAKLIGEPVTDVWNLGALDGDPKLDKLRRQRSRRIKSPTSRKKRKRK